MKNFYALRFFYKISPYSADLDPNNLQNYFLHELAIPVDKYDSLFCFPSFFKFEVHKLEFAVQNIPKVNSEKYVSRDVYDNQDQHDYFID